VAWIATAAATAVGSGDWLGDWLICKSHAVVVGSPSPSDTERYLPDTNNNMPLGSWGQHLKQLVMSMLPYLTDHRDIAVWRPR
jgi:hypothetical protein